MQAAMREIKIKKKSGGYRIVVAPNAQQKRRLRNKIPYLMAYVRRRDTDGIVHGFQEHRSPVTNAMKHAGYAATLTVDLKDFFDHVTLKHPGIEKRLNAKAGNGMCSRPNPDYIPRLKSMTHNSVARQGLPTSPALANICALDMDAELHTMIGKFNGIYTRYADDLSFSVPVEADVHGLLPLVREIVERNKFKINDKKTRIMLARRGRRVITGIAVDDKGIYPTRRVKRKLRAALHQGNKPQAMGLAEWCKLKQPKGRMPDIPEMRTGIIPDEFIVERDMERVSTKDGHPLGNVSASIPGLATRKIKTKFQFRREFVKVALREAARKLEEL